MSDIRVRFAPSPTGHLHVGGVRTALFNWLYAKQTNGKFIIRIEDTDQGRSTLESEKQVLSDLKWMELEWQEGPDIGGPYAPYRQSDRMKIYNDYADKLISQKEAFYCYCTDEELEKKREAALKSGETPHYDGTCRELTAEKQQEKEKLGLKRSIRFKYIPEDITFHDLIRGEITFKEGMVGDFIIIKSDGLPTYNFAVTVDDALMKISHVFRAEEHLSNTYRQIMIFKKLGFDIPKFGHFSLILGKDEEGHVAKLSKRHGATATDYYKQMGYLPEAMRNYLALLGWSSPTGAEILSTEQIISEFSLDRISRSPAIFDYVKLNWMNGMYIRALPIEDLTNRLKPYLGETGYSNSELQKRVDLIKGHLNYLSEVTKYFEIFNDDKFALDEKGKELLKWEGADKVLHAFKSVIENVPTITAENFPSIQDEIKKQSGQKGKNLFMPMRAAVTGTDHGPELKLFLPVIGKESALKKIEHAIKNL